MTNIVVWPHEVLPPSDVQADLVPFTRSGGRSLGGLEPVTRTDRGWWEIGLGGITLHTPAKRRTWNAIRVALGGRAGLVSVPVWSHDSAPWVDGRVFPYGVPHSDGSFHSDGTGYRQRRIKVEMASTVTIGDTSCTLRLVEGSEDLVGVRFSYQDALYETGPATDITGNLWTVSIFPAARTHIPPGATLEFDMPRCLCRLLDDRGMDHPLNVSLIDAVSVGFREAVEYWSEQAIIAVPPAAPEPQPGPTGTGTGVETGADTGLETGGDTGAETGGDTGLDTGAETGGDTGLETGLDTGADTGGDTGLDTGAETGGDTGLDTGADTGLGTGADTGSDTGLDSGAEALEWEDGEMMLWEDGSPIEIEDAVLGIGEAMIGSTFMVA